MVGRWQGGPWTSTRFPTGGTDGDAGPSTQLRNRSGVGETIKVVKRQFESA